MVLALLFAVASFLARREMVGGQHIVSCTTAAPADATRCMAFDRLTGDVRRVRCEDAQRTLDDLLDVGLLSAPLLGGISTVEQVPPRPVPADSVFIGSGRTAFFPRRPAASATDANLAARWRAVPRPTDGSLTPEAARSLLAMCAAAPLAELESRTIALTIVPRDYRGSLAVGVLGLLVVLLLLARSARVVVDPASGEVRIRERLALFAKSPVVVHAADVAAVHVERRGARSRVVLALRSGATVPLVASFALLGTREHERTVLALQRALGLAPAQP